MEKQMACDDENQHMIAKYKVETEKTREHHSKEKKQ